MCFKSAIQISLLPASGFLDENPAALYDNPMKGVHIPMPSAQKKPPEAEQMMFSSLLSASQPSDPGRRATGRYAQSNLLRYLEFAGERTEKIFPKPSAEQKTALDEAVWKLVLLYSSIHEDAYPLAESPSLSATAKKQLSSFIDRYFAFHFDQQTDNFAQSIRAFEALELNEKDILDPEDESIRTRYPRSHLSTTDKISGRVLAGELLPGVMESLAMEKSGSKSKITTNVSIDFDDLYAFEQIKGTHSLSPYDREVHNAIVTLYVEGKNRYITPQMIYRVMTGDPDARMSEVQAETIENSITKCMYGRITIDCKEEARAFGLEGLQYEGMLIPAERVTAKLNGRKTSCIHILRRPVLYDYASARNQIGRMDIHLLKSPINKNEETIALQGYLQRRILAMKHEKSRVSRTIVYDSVFKYVDVSAASDAALRDKQRRLRAQIKEILEYWVRETFILDYREINAKGEAPKPREKMYGIVINA